LAIPHEFERLQKLLLPVLAEASIGNFKTDLVAQPQESREFNELLMGVQALLEVIRQQQARLGAQDEQMHDLQNRTTEILARVLDRSLPGAQAEKINQ
jgi:hypothetical protein